MLKISERTNYKISQQLPGGSLAGSGRPGNKLRRPTIRQMASAADDSSSELALGAEIRRRIAPTVRWATARRPPWTAQGNGGGGGGWRAVPPPLHLQHPTRARFRRWSWSPSWASA